MQTTMLVTGTNHVMWRRGVALSSAVSSISGMVSVALSSSIASSSSHRRLYGSAPQQPRMSLLSRSTPSTATATHRHHYFHIPLRTMIRRKRGPRQVALHVPKNTDIQAKKVRIVPVPESWDNVARNSFLIRGLSPDVTEQDLREAFSVYGHVMTSYKAIKESIDLSDMGLGPTDDDDFGSRGTGPDETRLWQTSATVRFALPCELAARDAVAAAVAENDNDNDSDSNSDDDDYVPDDTRMFTKRTTALVDPDVYETEREALDDAVMNSATHVNDKRVFVMREEVGGSDISLMPLVEARIRAASHRTDLVQMSTSAGVAICRMTPSYKVKSALRATQKQQKQKKLKTVQFKVNIQTSDLDTKCARARSFLDAGHPVKVSVRGNPVGRQAIMSQISAWFEGTAVLTFANKGNGEAILNRMTKSSSPSSSAAADTEGKASGQRTGKKNRRERANTSRDRNRRNHDDDDHGGGGGGMSVTKPQQPMAAGIGGGAVGAAGTDGVVPAFDGDESD